MNHRLAVLTGIPLAACAAMGLALGVLPGCSSRGKATREENILRRTVALSDVGLNIGSPIQATVLRFSQEMDGTIGVYIKLSNAGTKRLLGAEVICTVSDAAGQPIGSTTGEPVPPGGLAKGESCEFRWFVRVAGTGGAATATASVGQTKTE